MIDEIRCQVVEEVWLRWRKVSTSDLIKALLQLMIFLIVLTRIVPKNNNSLQAMAETRCAVAESKVYNII